MPRYTAPFAILLCTSLLTTSPALADCANSPTPTCVTALAESTLEKTGAFDKLDAEHLLLSRLYLKQDNPMLAAVHAQRTSDPLEKARQLTAIAVAYWKSGEHNRATQLLDDAEKSLASLPKDSCMAATHVLYSLLVKEALLPKHISLPKRAAGSPLLADTTRLAMVKALGKKQELVYARKVTNEITHPQLRNLALMEYGEATLREQSPEKVIEAMQEITDPALLQEFREIRLPLALARHGDMTLAVIWSHKIENLSHKTDSFRRLAEFYHESGNGDKAVQVLAFARDFARKITEPYPRSAALKQVGRMYYITDHIAASRLTFAEALQSVLTIEYLPRRLSGIISLMEIQRELGDQKGLRETAFTAIRSGLFQNIDTYGKPGETNRFLTALDGMLSPNDRVELLEQVLTLKSKLLRGRILYKLSMLHFSDRISSTTQTERFEKVMKGITYHTDVLESVMMQILMAGAAEAMEDSETAKKLRDDAWNTLVVPITSIQSAAAMQRSQDDAWRLLARDYLAYNHTLKGLDAYRMAKGKDKNPELFLDAMLDKKLDVEALEFFPMELIALHSIKAETFDDFLDYYRLGLTTNAEENERRLLALLIVLGEKQQWEAAYKVMQVLRAHDNEKWFWQAGMLEAPSPALRRTMVMSAIDQQQYAQALELIEPVTSAPEKASLLIHQANEMLKEQDDADKKPAIAIPPLPEFVRKERCK